MAASAGRGPPRMLLARACVGFFFAGLDFVAFLDVTFLAIERSASLAAQTMKGHDNEAHRAGCCKDAGFTMQEQDELLHCNQASQFYVGFDLHARTRSHTASTRESWEKTTPHVVKKRRRNRPLCSCSLWKGQKEVRQGFHQTSKARPCRSCARSIENTENGSEYQSKHNCDKTKGHQCEYEPTAKKRATNCAARCGALRAISSAARPRDV